MSPQLRVLANHLDKKSSISAMEAHSVYRIRSLSRRICDLEELGWVFRRELRCDLTGQRYMKYHVFHLPTDYAR